MFAHELSLWLPVEVPINFLIALSFFNSREILVNNQLKWLCYELPYFVVQVEDV